MARLSGRQVVTLQELVKAGVSNVEAARLLGVTEGAVRYHLRRQAEGASDGRARQAMLAESFRPAIDAYLEAVGEKAPRNVTELHDWLVAEHDYPGSVRNLQRYVRRAFPSPPVRARRRIETPPGAQAQVDWAHFERVLVAGREVNLVALSMVLSHSRADAIVWSASAQQLAWLSCHNEAFRRLGGVPATVRVDNVKTAVVRGAGAWGVLNATYRRYAESVRFHIDACQPRSPEAKGKVERRIREQRYGCNPYTRHWNDLAELQAWTDERASLRWARRTCPATGTSVAEAHRSELAALAPVGVLPEPFDIAVTRRVNLDCTVNFESRAYSVPFAFVGQQVEVRGCHATVQILAGASIIAVHPRGTAERIVLAPAHFEGAATDTVLPPQPLGKMGRRLEEIASMKPENRPLDLYAALAEAAADRERRRA